LVQGNATSPDEVRTNPAGFEEYWSRIFEVQPKGSMWSANALMRFLFDWYYMRQYIFVRPRRILWWPGSDFGQASYEAEVDHAG